MEIYLVRHTKTDVRPGICFGQSDVELADTFLTEAELIKTALPVKPDALFTSPLKRCGMLAGKLYSVPYLTDNRLMEMDFGDWEMMKWDDIPADKLMQWTDNYVTQPPPGGECFTALYNRVKEFFNERVLNSGCSSVVIITHAGVIRSVLALALNIDLPDTFNYSVNHGEVFKVSFCNGEFSVNGLRKNH